MIDSVHRGWDRARFLVLVTGIVAVSSGCGDGGGGGGGGTTDPPDPPTPTVPTPVPEHIPASGATANIIVVGDVGRGDPSVAPRSLGLLAENDVIVDPAVSPPVRTIQAAMLASTGAVRIPAQYRTPVRQPDQPYARSGTLDILGSVASHGSVALRWSWGSDWVGFGTRRYAWDPSLASYGPPFWPSNARWQVIDQSEANADCYGSTATMRGADACR